MIILLKQFYCAKKVRIVVSVNKKVSLLIVHNDNCTYCKVMLAQRFITYIAFCTGADCINSASKERNSDVAAVEGSYVHPNCRKRYTDKKYIALFKRKCNEEMDMETNRKSQRLSQVSEKVIIKCLFCDQMVDLNNSKMMHRKYQLISLCNQF